MTAHSCPVCGCLLSGEGDESERAISCCEPCAAGSVCACGCCIEEEKEEKE